MARAPMVDLAANPSDQDRVIASAGDGVLTVYDHGSGDAAVLENAPAAVLLDWPLDDLLIGVTARGQVYRSVDAGRTWTAASHVPGEPEALDVTEQTWHVATTRGIYRSDDSGRSWQMVVAAEG